MAILNVNPALGKADPCRSCLLLTLDGITPMVHEPTVRATLTGQIPFPKNDSYLALIYMVSISKFSTVATDDDF